MAQVIKIKSSSVPDKKPTISDLQLRELGVNTHDGKLFLKKSDGTNEEIVTINEYDVAFEKLPTTDSDGRDFGYNVTGVTRGTGTDFADLQAGALDMVWGDASVPNKGVGQFSIGNGYNISGSGYASITAGWDNHANANYALMCGISNDTAAPGGQLVAGVCIDATKLGQGIACGSANTVPATSGLYSFQVGNGTFAANPVWPVPLGERAYNATVRSDAFRVYHTSGVAECPSTAIADIDTIGDKALVTLEYLNDKVKIEVFDEQPTITSGSPDVVLANQAIASTLRVYKNGLRQAGSADYTYDDSTSTVTFNRNLRTRDVVVVDYKY